MPLARHPLTITDEFGNILNGASVEVRNEATGLLPQLYSDRAGTISIGNPFTAADGADAGFHATGGSYKITATLGAFSRIWRYVGIGTASETDTAAQAPIFVNIKDYGAVGDAATDDTAAIQAAIDAAQALHGAIFIPASANGYKVIGSGAQVFSITAGVSIIGEGFGSLIFVDSSVPNTRNIFGVAITAAATGFVFRDFSINNFGAAAGKRGISFDSAFTASNVEIAKVLISPMNGGESIYFKTVAYSNIHDCNIESIRCEDVGDGIHVYDNIITGSSTRPAIRASFVAGAAGFIVSDNVIATTDVHVRLDNGQTPTISYNEFETPVSVTNTYGFLVDVGVVSAVNAPQLIGNQYSVLGSTGNPIAVRLRTGTANARIADARYLNQTGGQHIQVDAGATDTAIDRNAQFITNGVIVAPAITDNGTRTGWVQYFADGTAALPAWAFLGDRDSGFYRIGANNIGLTLNGVKAIDFQSVGISFNGIQFLPAVGTATVAPIKFTSGTNLTTADAGALEYDGKVVYATPNASNRGVSPAVHFLSLSANQTGTDTASAQVWFPGGGATQITLPASTTYFFEGFIAVTKTAGTVSRTIDMLFGGGATLTSIAYRIIAHAADSSVFSAGATDEQAGFAQVAGAYGLWTTASTAANQVFYAYVHGMVRINGAGTFIPQFKYSAAPGGAPTVQANTWFRMWPAGTNTALNVGNWS
jgi:Pectate lyase superfamily protein